MSKISLSSLFGKQSPNKQDTPQTPVITPPSTDPDAVQDTIQSSWKYICEICPKWGELSDFNIIDVLHNSPQKLADHVKDNHPSEWPFQLTITKSKNHAKKWKTAQVKIVIDTYLQVRAKQNVGRRLLITKRKTNEPLYKNIINDARWVYCSKHPDTSMFAHIKALNAAAIKVGRSCSSVRDVLNGTLGLDTKGMAKHQSILIYHPGGKGHPCKLTIHGLKQVKQIRDKQGYIGSGGIEGLDEMSSNTVQKTEKIDSVIKDPIVEQPQDTNNLVKKDESYDILSTWTNLNNDMVRHIVELRQQVTNSKNHDQNRIDKEDDFLKEMEAKDSAIVAKDKIIESQKQHIAQLTINGM